MLFTALAAEYKTITSPTCTYFCVSWTAFICFSWEMISWKRLLNRYFLSDITFLENPFSFEGDRETESFLFERFFLDVHLAFT